jgi:oligoendopeptidase F
MEDEERAHRDTHFQEELESLKANMTRFTSLLNQTCGNVSGKGPTTDLSPLIRLQ